jgi:pyruvate dehydrogenase E2 component (dihydrolipoamide acetyltransferase)
MAVEIFMPKMSDHMEYGEIIGWLVAEGERVDEGQPVLEVMTDKATAEIEAPAAGLLGGIRKGVEPGARVPVGETLAFVLKEREKPPALPPLQGGEPVPRGPGESETGFRGGELVARKPGKEAADLQGAGKGGGVVGATPLARKTAEQHNVSIEEIRGSGAGGRVQREDVIAHVRNRSANVTVAPGLTGTARGKASPAARRRAREYGLDLGRITGTGPGGLVREDDVLSFYEGVSTDGTPGGEGEGEWLELNPVQRLVGERMTLSASTAPQFSLSLHADVENLLSVRELLMKRTEEETGRRLSVTTMLVKVVAEALKRYPRANSSFEGGRIRLYGDINVGVAVGTERGLVVPVVTQADRKTLAQINAEMGEFEAKAREMRFSASDLDGGHFTVTNLGMYGIEAFSAIVNPPQSSILAVGSIVNTPVGGDDGEDSVVLKKLMNLTLTVDHRCMDGVQGAAFLNIIRDLIEEPDTFRT